MSAKTFCNVSRLRVASLLELLYLIIYVATDYMAKPISTTSSNRAHSNVTYVGLVVYILHIRDPWGVHICVIRVTTTCISCLEAASAGRSDICGVVNGATTACVTCSGAHASV